MEVRGQPHAPAASTPGKDPVPIVQEAEWAPGTVWTGAENIFPTGLRSPDRPALGQSLYRLSYRAHCSRKLSFILKTVNFPCNCIARASLFQTNLHNCFHCYTMLWLHPADIGRKPDVLKTTYRF